MDIISLKGKILCHSSDLFHANNQPILCKIPNIPKLWYCMAFAQKLPFYLIGATQGSVEGQHLIEFVNLFFIYNKL